MGEKHADEIERRIRGFFDGTYSFVPHISFLRMNRELDDDSYFIVALLDHNPPRLDTFCSTLIKKGTHIRSMQSETFGDGSIVYVVATNDKGIDTDDISGIKGISHAVCKQLSQLEKNPFTYPVSYDKGHERMLNLVHDLYHSMIRIIPNSLGSGGDYLLHLAGANAAQYIWRRFGFSTYDEFEDQVAFLEDIYRTIGFGILSFEGLDPLKSEGRIIIREPFEACRGEDCERWEDCESGKLYRSRGTTCTFTRGFLTEMVKRIFDDNSIDLVESECVTKGDEQCVFELTRTREL